MHKAAVTGMIGSAAWGFRELDLPSQLAIARKKGMAYHELGIANGDTDIPLDATDEALEAVKALYRDYGLSLTCAATGNDFTGADAQNQVQKVLQVISMCRKLGVEKLRIFTGFTPLAAMTDDQWKVLLDALRIVAAEAKMQGVCLCVETHGAVEPLLDGVRHIRSTTTQLPELLRILEAADVQLVLDPANLYAVGETDLESLFDAVKHRIGYIHLKDFCPGSGGQLYPCALGGGGTPWEPLKEKMLQLNVPLLFEYENPQDLEAGLDQCMECWKGVNPQ